MNSPSDAGGKVLVNPYAGSKGTPGGKKKSSTSQSKNAPDSRSSATGSSNGRTGSGSGSGSGTGISRSTSATSSSGGFQSFFRWFRRDDSRVLARSSSGTEVTAPELLNRRGAVPQPPHPRSQVGESSQAGSVEEEQTTAGTSDIKSNKSSASVSQSAGRDGETHSSSPSPGPVIDCSNLSKSSSCDSILSTATNGFAFVPPNCYEAVLARNRGNPELRRTIQPGPYTDSYKRRCRQRDQSRELDRKYELTLRKKYRLFGSLRLRESPARDRRRREEDRDDSTTLTRTDQRPIYADLSLPAYQCGVRRAPASNIPLDSGCGTSTSNDDPQTTLRRHRRTVSDSCKDRRAGAYVHVKGKRRAPPPPPPAPAPAPLSPDGTSQPDSTLTRPYPPPPNYGTLSPGSTLSTRKKRPAPAPPPVTSSSTSLLEDKEIKAIIEGRSLPLLRKPTPPEEVREREPEPLIMPLPLIRPLSPLPNISEERAPLGGLTEEQKQQLIDNIRKVQSQAASADQPTPTATSVDDPCDVMRMEEHFSRTNGTRSPIHDYLYAEAIASARTSTVQPTPPSTGPPAAATTTVPTSPISPRPWYKRPISGIRQQESSLPFKRDIILKTIDKRKGGSAKENGRDDLPEVGYCRNSMLPETANGGIGGKFNLFAKITEKSTDDSKRRERDAEKRRSAIGIPSISELDREAAEIVHNEYRMAPGLEDGKQKSTKELISKFEATSVPVVGKVTVNSSFVARKDYFGVDEEQTKKPAPATTSVPAADTPSQATKSSSNGGSSPTDTRALAKTGSDKNLLGLWNCPYCTLENPNWRIICEACERIKPYEGQLPLLEEPKRPDASTEQPTSSSIGPTGRPADDWDKKTERVLKYFMPKPLAAPATNGTLLVGGTSGDDQRASLMQRKPTYGQTKPLASPKMGVKSRMKRGPSPYRSFNVVPPPEPCPEGVGAAGNSNSNKFDDQKLKENGHGKSHGTMAPLASPEPTGEKDECALYAAAVSKAAQVNIEEIRSARIARFGGPELVPPEAKCILHDPPLNDPVPGAAKTKEQQDQEALEKEKERLREMIRAMNAKALAEKYPVAVVQKPPSNSLTPRDSPLVQRKNGLSSGIPISTKTVSPLPSRKSGGSPLVARKSPAPDKETNPRKDFRESVAIVEPTPVMSSPHTGAIRKTFFPRRIVGGTNEQNPNLGESKPNNLDRLIEPGGTIPETVTELNNRPTAVLLMGSGPSLVLTNDVQGIHYEPMDEQQFARLAASSIPRPSNVSPLSPRLQDRHRKSLLERQQQQQQQQHDEKVKQISDQLQSQQGLDRFRTTLLCEAPGGFGRTGTLALNKLLRSLEHAIGEGAHDRAAELATDLAKMKVSLSVTRQSPARSTCSSTSSGSLTDLSLNVYIDDKMSHKGPLTMTLAAFGTLGQLKQKLCNDYQIPVGLQRWRYDDRPLDEDGKTLFDYGIQSNDRTLHVFLVQPSRSRAGQLPLPGFTRTEAKLLTVSSESEGEHSDTQNDEKVVVGAIALPPTPAPREQVKPEAIVDGSTTVEGWVCSVCTLINPPKRPGCAACSAARPDVRLNDHSITVTPEDLKRFIDEQPPLAPGRRTTPKESATVGQPRVQLRNLPQETRNDLNRISSNRKSSDVFNILLDENKVPSDGSAPVPVLSMTAPVPKPRTSEPVRQMPAQVPEKSRISVTAGVPAHRSPNITRSHYRGVDNFNPNSSGMSKPERPIITTASPIVRAVLLKGSASAIDRPAAVRFGRNGLALPEDGMEVAPNHYTELVNLDNADLIANIEPFECPICLGPFQPYEGIVLRDCLHSFCKQCLISTIQYSEDAEIRCPYIDTVYSCESIIQQREIKALVNKELYEAYLSKSIQQAVSAMDNTFHCQTPNCRGWCTYEDNVNQFKCPICRIVNCLTCRVVHDGLDCKQYQDRMNSDCDTNLEARRTKEMLQEMIEKGDALNCPTCQVIVMKKWGCDWLKCSMCKTEICWVTRGPRWGPAGKGDTTGGCRCGVNGIKCHRKCNYCH